MGRPSTRNRTEFGQRVFERRETIGLTQAEVAEQLELSQRAYSSWERDAVAIRPERLTRLAKVLGTTVADLLGEAKPSHNGGVSSGRLGQSFEAVSQLSRRQQTKILDVVEAMLAQQTVDASS